MFGKKTDNARLQELESRIKYLEEARKVDRLTLARSGEMMIPSEAAESYLMNTMTFKQETYEDMCLHGNTVIKYILDHLGLKVEHCPKETTVVEKEAE